MTGVDLRHPHSPSLGLPENLAAWGLRAWSSSLPQELEAIEDTETRKEEYEKRVAQMYDRGKAVNFATAFEIDEVIDPKILVTGSAGFKSTPKPVPREGKNVRLSILGK